MAVAPGVAAAAAAATAMAPEVNPQDAPESSTFRALAWSEADDIPDVAPTDPYEYAGPANGGGLTADARPQMQFEHDPYEHQAEPPLPWYRRPAVALVAGVLVLLGALTAAVLYVMRDDSTPAPASTTTPTTTTTPPPDTTRGAATRGHNGAAADAGAPDPHGHSAGAATAGDRDGNPCRLRRRRPRRRHRLRLPRRRRRRPRRRQRRRNRRHGVRRRHIRRSLVCPGFLHRSYRVSPRSPRLAT